MYRSTSSQRLTGGELITHYCNTQYGVYLIFNKITTHYNGSSRALFLERHNYGDYILCYYPYDVSSYTVDDESLIDVSSFLPPTQIKRLSEMLLSTTYYHNGELFINMDNHLKNTWDLVITIINSYNHG